MATPLTSADSERRIRRRGPGGHAWSRRRPVVAPPGTLLALRHPRQPWSRPGGHPLHRSRRSSRPASARKTAGEKKEQREEPRRKRGCRQPPAELQIWPPPVTWRPTRSSGCNRMAGQVARKTSHGVRRYASRGSGEPGRTWGRPRSSAHARRETREPGLASTEEVRPRSYRWR
ncbi:hypothetical protein MRX96_006558 [Rhipicephalus microplus]